MKVSVSPVRYIMNASPARSDRNQDLSQAGNRFSERIIDYFWWFPLMSLVCWQRHAVYKTPWNGWKYLKKIVPVTQQFPAVRDSALQWFPLHQHRGICKKSRFLSFLMNVWHWVSWAQFQDLTERIVKWNLCALSFSENTFRQISEEALLLVQPYLLLTKMGPVYSPQQRSVFPPQSYNRK